MNTKLLTLAAILILNSSLADAECTFVTNTSFDDSCSDCGPMAWNHDCTATSIGTQSGERYVDARIVDHSTTCTGLYEPVKNANYGCKYGVNQPLHEWYEPTGGSFGLDATLKEVIEAQFGVEFNWEATSTTELDCSFTVDIPQGQCGTKKYCHIKDNYLQAFAIVYDNDVVIGHWDHYVDEHGQTHACDSDFGDAHDAGDEHTASLPCNPCIGKDTVAYTNRGCESPSDVQKNGHYPPKGDACVYAQNAGIYP